MKKIILSSVLVPLLLAAPISHAHSQLGLDASLVAGFSHPLLGFDHLLAMILVGVWAVIIDKKAWLTLPLTFVTVMLMGGLLALNGIALPAVETVIAISVIMLGGLVATGYRPIMSLSLFSVALLALFHGYAHGAKMALNANVAWYFGGILAATVLLHGFGVLSGMLLRNRFVIIMRIGGISAAASGVWMLAS